MAEEKSSLPPVGGSGGAAQSADRPTPQRTRVYYPPHIASHGAGQIAVFLLAQCLHGRHAGTPGKSVGGVGGRVKLSSEGRNPGGRARACRRRTRTCLLERVDSVKVVKEQGAADVTRIKPAHTHALGNSVVGELHPSAS